MLQDIFELSGTPNYPPGMRHAVDERVFRYALIGGEAANGGRAVANLSTSIEATVAPVDAALAQKLVTITIAGTEVTINELRGGYLCYKAGGRYFRHRIKSHPAATNAATCVLTLETALVGVGITAGDMLCAYHNPWAKVGWATGANMTFTSFVGVPFDDIAIGQYTWVQTWGPVTGTPSAFCGGTATERQAWFDADGSLATTGLPAQNAPYQLAGFWIPLTYWGGAGHHMEDGGHLLFLQIAP